MLNGESTNAVPEESGSHIWPAIGMAAALNALATYYVPIAVEPEFLLRMWLAAIGLACALGAAWLAVAAWNLRTRPWRPPSLEQTSIGALILVAVTIYGSWPNGTMPSSAALAQFRASAAKGSSVTTAVADQICGPDQRFAYNHCIDDAPSYVERNWLGRCPTGYVDHPRSPQLCTLPWIRDRRQRR